MLERPKEALGLRVLPRRSLRRHADLRACRVQSLDVVATGVLNPPVRVMDPASPRSPADKRLLQGRYRERRIDAARQRPPHHLTGEGIQDRGEITEAG